MIKFNLGNIIFRFHGKKRNRSAILKKISGMNDRIIIV